ncbi:MAG: S8 family serine peptidase, partial [Chloroflexi bacterium]|nr:S8 family serine peptidase [Chloroflexota bacterium]
TGSGSANYYVMTGTSRACPIAAGAGALLLDKVSGATPLEVYDAIQNSASTSGTGSVPNDTWGYGKLDVLAALNQSPFPVELSSFIAKSSKDGVQLDWVTQTEVNNYGFDILRQTQNRSE